MGYANEEHEHLEKLGISYVHILCAGEKRDGPVRWCIDLRNLNDVIVKDYYPLPLLQDCIDALEGCRYFTTLDMASGYYQLKLAEADRDKTVFVTK